MQAGEEITVVRQDVGEGWWEGINSQGTQGLFPEAYVQVNTLANVLKFLVFSFEVQIFFIYNVLLLLS